MALHKLPKGYSSDFRLPNKKPTGAALMEHGERGDYWLFQNRDFLSNSGSRTRRLENVGGTFNQGLQLSTSTSTYVKFSDVDDPYYESMTGGLTVAFKMPSAPVMTQYDTLVSCCTSAGSGWRIWTRSSSNAKLYFEVFDGASKQAISTTSISQMTNKWIVCTHDGVNIRLYIDGVLEDKTACGSVVYPFAGRSTKGLIGGMPANSDASLVQRSPQMSIDHLYIAPKAIDSPEKFKNNPYQILKPKNDPIYFTSAAGGTPTLYPSFIPSAEEFYTASVENMLSVIEPNFITTQESVYNPEVSPQGITILPDYIPSEEVVYSPAVVDLLQVLSPAFIPTEETVYSPEVERLLQLLYPSYIESEETTYNPTVTGGDSISIPLTDRRTWNAIAQYLRDLVFTGQDNDVIQKWFISEGYEGEYNENWNSYLADQGYTDGNLSDRYSAWRKQ